jgi:hypothetical protein
LVCHEGIGLNPLPAVTEAPAPFRETCPNVWGREVRLKERRCHLGVVVIECRELIRDVGAVELFRNHTVGTLEREQPAVYELPRMHSEQRLGAGLPAEDRRFAKDALPKAVNADVRILDG